MDLAGLAGRARAGWVEPWARPNPVDRFCFFLFFLKYIFSAKEFQRNSSNSFKTLKILRKSQKFQENS
jgi:hypothetical protein